MLLHRLPPVSTPQLAVEPVIERPVLESGVLDAIMRALKSQPNMLIIKDFVAKQGPTVDISDEAVGMA